MKYISSKILPFIFLTLFIHIGFGQGIEAPVEVQASIFNKVLTMERAINKKIKVSGKLTIGIVYQSKYRASLNAYNKLVKLYKKMTYNRKKINIKAINIDKAEEIAKGLDPDKSYVLLVTPLRAIDIGDITKISEQKKILTLSLVADYVKQGLSVGLQQNADKPEILINLESAKKEGADFSSHLLKIVTIIK